MRDDDDDDNSTILEPPRSGRRRRRSRTDRHDPLIPWQAMKRLRVDATASANDSSFLEAEFLPSSSAYDNHRMMPTPPDRVDATAVLQPPQRRIRSPHDHQTPTVTNRDVNRNNYDAYHCYQRHQHQETGQDTDGWSSPESRPHPPYDRGPFHSATTSSSLVRQLHDHPMNRTLESRNNRHATPLLDISSSDDEDIMDYHNVNHILGNLHLERQQRMVQQQRYAPSQQNDNDSYMDDDDDNHNIVPLRNDVGGTGIHESISSSFANRTDSSLLSTVPPTPLNTRMMLRQQSQQYLNHEYSQQPHPSSLDQYQTPPAKPTKRKVVPLYTNSKLG